MQLYPAVLQRIESGFDVEKARLWYGRYWTLSIYATAVYLLLIYLGQRWMKDRTAFGLRKPLVVWNIGLAVFSAFGALQLCPGLIRDLYKHGLHYTFCSGEYLYTMPAVTLWGHVFILSKLVELGDTAFIVLRKTPLPFIHWYHHTTVFIFSFYLGTSPPAFLPWFGNMNYCIHSVMYSYYAIRASGRKISSKIALGITILQLTQMILGVGITMFAFMTKFRGDSCVITDDVFYFSMAIYTTYAMLFMRFLYQRYCVKSSAS